MNDRTRHEVSRVVLAAVSNEATADELAWLQDRMREDEQLVSHVVDLMSQESWLSWSRGVGDDDDLRGLLQPILSMGAERPETSEPAAQSRPRGANGPLGLAPLAGWGLAAATLLIGFGVGLGAGGWRFGGDPVVVVDAADRSARDDFAVRYVGGTACLWSTVQELTPDAGSEFRAGESLNLLQGIAELDFELPHGSARLQIEGPAGLVITRGQNASLGQGVFTVQTSPGADPFILQTPIGRLDLRSGSSAGVRVDGGKVEVHVFRGFGQVLMPWTASQNDKLLRVEGGSSLALLTDTNGLVSVSRSIADEESFTANLPMRADALPLPSDYETLVLEAKPLLYWRFDRAEGDRVVDRSGNGLDGQIFGEVERLRSGTNASLALGMGYSHAAIEAHVRGLEPITDRLPDAYTLELWVKPSHYHWGCLISLLGCRPDTPEYCGHGALLELGGALREGNTLEQPGKFRYLHRDPPSEDTALGASCYSDVVYSVRRWQHVVAVKRSEAMRLYVDGALSSEITEPSGLADGLSVLLGQLDEHQTYRRFVGHLDEVAVYPYALDEPVIRQHYEAVKEAASPGVFTARPGDGI